MSITVDVAIIGAGNAGISAAARLRRQGWTSIALIDGQQVYRYRPMLNYAATGQARMRRFERPMAQVIPHGVRWVPDHVESLDPEAQILTTSTGLKLPSSRW